MDSLVSIFHLDVKLLIAQAVNFAIVLAVLYWLVFKPLTKVMAERGEKIERGVRQAEAIAQEWEAAKGEQAKILAEARREAAKIIEEARGVAEEKKQKLIDRAKLEIGELINQEKADLQAEKTKTLKEIKAETAALVVSVCAKLLGEAGSQKLDKERIAKLLS